MSSPCDQRVRKMLDRHSGRELRASARPPGPDGIDFSIAHQDDAVVEITIAPRIAGAIWRAQESQNSAADRAHTQASGYPIQCAGALAASHGRQFLAALLAGHVRDVAGRHGVRAHGAAISISGACSRMCSSVSSKMPFGAAAMSAQTGSVAWHMAQRDMTMLLTSVNFGVGGCSARRPRWCARSGRRQPGDRRHAGRRRHTPSPPRAALCLHGAN